MRIYIDTNVYLDYLYQRKNRQGKDLGRPAFNIFKRAISCEFEILGSNYLFKELCGNIDLTRIRMLSIMLKKKIIKIIEDMEDLKKAAKYQHKDDAVHAILAIKGNADIIVTRNKNHFKEFSIKAKLPEEL